jgi:hypothetical protein
MSVRVFRDDDAGYLGWVAAHPDGYVINIARSRRTSDSRLHQAGCRTISGQSPRGGGWTGTYVKVCAEQLDELEQWAIDQVGQPIPRCRTCCPTRRAAFPISGKHTDRAVARPALEGRCEVRGPLAGEVVVEAWADDYIRFERRPAWQEQLRNEIRTRCRRLEPAAGQVLHARFFGGKPANADVENLVLYNIDSFNAAGRNGIRFELGAAVPPTPDGVQYRFCYRYALAPRSAGFADWRPRRRLASFDWTDLGQFARDKQLAQVWWALARSRIEVIEPALAPGRPFAVKVQLRPPHGRAQPMVGQLLKGIFDGVVCAFQAHADAAGLPAVAARIAGALHAEAAQIEQLLGDRRRAVLGAVPRLVFPYGAGVKWDPADHWCVAGELLLAESVGPRWAIAGELVELF